MLQPLEKPTLPGAESESLATYLLLESAVLEEWLMQQPDSPEQPNISAFVRQVDYATILRWIWNDTEYDKHHADGPLLVQYQPGSPLPALFTEAWAPTGGAVLITSLRPIDEVVAQLRAALFVLMPDGKKARFRLQETDALSSVLQAIEPHRAAQLLGPVQEMIWRENHGPEHQWWRYRQSGGPYPVQGGFQFHHAEMTAIDAGLNEYHLRKQTALTQLAPHSFRDSARQQTQVWLEQLRHWGFAEFHHLDLALDAFRHPSYTQRASAVVALLQDATLTPGARSSRALNLLMTEGH
ncbi:DUF4123 domain-containing protein [Pseudomonas protegens]|uniref:DUF4123 domain-containing protein n=1 Tax=Pseudomonas protegens TaxID=380021 RepID=UPI001F41286A|nr:DUF4123 domain-containing protein [Pseudomonas protegens]